MSDPAQITIDLTDPDIDLRKKAVFQAGELKITSAVPTLIELLKSDPDNVVRNSAARALGKIADPNQHDAVLDALCQATQDPDYYTKVNACWSLGRLKDKRAIPYLVSMIDPSKVVYMASGDGKTDADQKSVSSELKETGVQYSDTIVKAITALGDIGDPEGNDALFKALKDEQDGNVRCAAALALGKIGTPDAVGPLLEAVNDKYWYVRRDVAKAFKTFKDPRTIKPLVRLLSDMYDQVKKNAMDTLIAIGKPAAKELMVLFFNQPKNVQLQNFVKTLTKPELTQVITEIIENEKDPNKKNIYQQFLAQLTQ